MTEIHKLNDGLESAGQVREVRSCTHVPERRRTEPQPPREIVEPEEWRMES